MNMTYYGLAAGAITGAILLFITHIAPVFSAGKFVKDLDNPRVLGRAVSLREGHLIGILVYFVFSCFFGGLYAFLVQAGVFADFGLLSLLGWGMIMALCFGGIILPLEGHGVFGVKEDAWFPVDLLLTDIIWVLVFWWIMKLWPVIL